jgi:spermidine/putrescine transport system permease protein
VSATVTSPSEVTTTATPSDPQGQRKGWRHYVLPAYTLVFLLYLMVPIAVMIVYSFNESRSHLPNVTFQWQGFTLRWYREWNQIPGLTKAFFVSLRLAFLSSLGSCAAGTFLALALVRYRFRGKGTTEQVMFANIAAPEIVLGASLLGLFITVNFPLGFLTLIIAHVMFSIAYVTITVRARLSGYDLNVEHAAQDLGATPWVTFWRITFPLIFPAILSGFLLAFALSIDDFVTSYFVSGKVETFPIWVYGAVKVGTPPQVFVMGTFIFATGVLIAFVTLIRQGRKNREARAPGLG